MLFYIIVFIYFCIRAFGVDIVTTVTKQQTHLKSNSFKCVHTLECSVLHAQNTRTKCYYVCCVDTFIY